MAGEQHAKTQNDAVGAACSKQNDQDETSIIKLLSLYLTSFTEMASPEELLKPKRNVLWKDVPPLIFGWNSVLRVVHARVWGWGWNSIGYSLITVVKGYKDFLMDTSFFLHKIRLLQFSHFYFYFCWTLIASIYVEFLLRVTFYSKLLLNILNNHFILPEGVHRHLSYF